MPASLPSPVRELGCPVHLQGMGSVPEVVPESPDGGGCGDGGSRFSNLRGVRWRIDLGILPCLGTASVDQLRRVAADCRRRYASLRRRLLVDPHISKDGNSSPDLVVDNPLSQNPDSTWGRFFRNAELEKMVDKDLSRLYPEHGSYFQTSACQAMLRRILLLWCLRHPEYGYRQGMHELLAPLLYVLYIDVQHLSEVQSLYEDYLNDDFNAMSFPNGDLVSNYRHSKPKNWIMGTDEEFCSTQSITRNINNLDDFDSETRDMFLLSDAYGAEGELGVVISERFMEHDAYCMFNSLMNGGCGVVSMADFFSPSPAFGSSSGLPPVIEASSSLYHLLSLVDPYLHSHLVELSVEPQYFALRWLRVLFGREFSLENLLIIWDEIFSCPNNKVIENYGEYSVRVLCSPRGAFISAIAVSMLLHLRSSLLATEYATACLQRLLNFPENVNVRKLIEKGRSLEPFALKSIVSSLESLANPALNKSMIRRGHSASSGSVSPETSLYQFPESYWEEKWRVMHNDGAAQKVSSTRPGSSEKAKVLLGDKFGLSRTESDPSPTIHGSNVKVTRSSVKRSLLDDLSRGMDSEVINFTLGSEGTILAGASASLKPEEVKPLHKEVLEQNDTGKGSLSVEETCLSGENSSLPSTASSPHSLTRSHEIENDSEKSSVTSNSFAADNENDELIENVEACSNTSHNPQSEHSGAAPVTMNSSAVADTDAGEKETAIPKGRNPFAGKFQWFLKFRANADGASGRASTVGDTSKAIVNNSSVLASDASGATGRVEVGDKKVMDTLKTLGQSMLENIQVIESVFQQDRSPSGSLENLSNNILGSKGHVKAMGAIKELRKISNLLSEM